MLQSWKMLQTGDFPLWTGLVVNLLTHCGLQQDLKDKEKREISRCL